MINNKRPLRVFLCHASGDKPAVENIYKRLLRDNIDAWLDKEKILPGQNWQLEIPKAVYNSDVVIVFLSTQSVTKEGYVQKEIKFALDAADEKPEGTIFIIPARFENCEVPERISKYQWVDLFSPEGYKRLLKALQARANTIGAIITTEEKKHAPKKLEKANTSSTVFEEKIKPIQSSAHLTKKVDPISQSSQDTQNPLWKRLVVSLGIFILFFIAGQLVGLVIFFITNDNEIAPFIGAIPTWLYGIFLIYKVWRRQ